MDNTLYVDHVSQKTCSQCNITLPITSFGKRGYNKKTPTIKRAAACYKCAYRKYVQPSVRKKTDLIQMYKLKRGCTDCGYNSHPEALEFDHTDDNKKFTIGSQIANYSVESLMEEVSKCEVVCANCHAVRTANRRKLVTLSNA
jgi:hypothetical protein